MNRFRVGHPSPALVVSVIALVVALGGTSYAAFSLPKNSVGTKQIKKGAVTNAKLAKGAVTNAKLANGAVTNAKLANRAVNASKIVSGSLTGTDVAPGSLTGANINLSTLGKVPSAAIADAAAIAKVQVVTASGTNTPAAYSASNVAAATASCPSGLVVLGGGVHVSDQTNQSTNDSYPSAGNAWTADVFNSGPGTPSFTVYAICGPAASIANSYFDPLPHKRAG